MLFVLYSNYSDSGIPTFTFILDSYSYFTKKGDSNSEDAKKFYWWSIRREEEEFILGRGPRTDFDPLLNYAVYDPVPQGSYPTVDEVLTKAQFLSPLLYQIH